MATAAPPTYAQQAARIPGRVMDALRALGAGQTYGTAEPTNSISDLARARLGRGSVFGVPEDVQQRNVDRAMEAASIAAPIKRAIIAPEQFAQMATKGKINVARSQEQELADLLAGKTNFAEARLNWDMPETYDLADKLAKQGLQSKVDARGVTRFYKNPEDLKAIESAKNPTSFGKAYGYSDNDIAAFYLARRQGNKDLAYKEFLEDQATKIKDLAKTK
jgi:hypothetical protein